MAPSVPKPDANNTPMCIKHALFLHNLSPALIFLAPLFFAALSAILTQCIRYVTPGVRVKPKTPTPADATTTTTTTTTNASVDVETTAIPDPASQPVDVEAGEAPPPYAPPTTETPAPTTVSAAEPVKPKVKQSSAQNFVLGTTFLIPLLFTIVCLALSIQRVTYCNSWSPTSTTAQVFSWLFFCIPTFWASCGVACWAMLVRDLWGPKMREKYPFKEDAILQGTVVGVLCAIALPFMAVGMGMVKCVEGAQRAWCGDALLDEEERGEGGVEIGELVRVEESVAEAETEGIAVEGENGEGSEGRVESEEHGENVGLIRGMEK